MIDLEQELGTAMRQRADGLRPSRDLLAAARRANGRRGLAVKATSAVGALGLGGAVALALPGLTTATPTPSIPAPASSAPASSGPASSGPASSVSASPAPVELSIAFVSARVRAVLADERGKVQFLDLRRGGGGLEPGRSEIWYDAVTGAQRTREHGSNGAVTSDFSIAQRGDRVISRFVDHRARTWYTTGDRGRLERSPGGLMMGTPAQIKAELEHGTWALAGTEGGTLHLTQSFDDGAAGFELWVDAGSFEVVRMAASKPGDGAQVREEGAVKWLPRTKAVLADLVAEAPAGFRQIERPADPPAGPGQG